MLQKQTVKDETLELLKDLMQDKRLTDFFLVGGTALSLQIGHRISIDIDLFSIHDFNENQLSEYLEIHKGFKLNYLSKNAIKGQIGNVQVDLITHSYPLMNNLLTEDNIRMADTLDISAMKLNAITGSGTRLKDFVDIAFLSIYHSLNEMVVAYMEKYNSRNPLIPLKALGYFDDINFDEPLMLINGIYKWNLIQRHLSKMLKNPDKKFIEVK